MTMQNYVTTRRVYKQMPSDFRGNICFTAPSTIQTKFRIAAEPFCTKRCLYMHIMQHYSMNKEMVELECSIREAAKIRPS